MADHAHSATACPVPSSTATPAPSTTAATAPSFNATPAPSTAAGHVPCTTTTPAPSLTAAPALSINAIPASSTTVTPAPSIITTPSTTTGAVFPTTLTLSTYSASSTFVAAPSATVAPSSTTTPSAVSAPFATAAPAPSTTGMTVDYARVKLVCILMGPGAAVLRHALKCGTNKAPSVTLLDYLASLPDSSTANYHYMNGERKRRAFTSDERRTIGNDPSCQTFDITLLYKSIKLACERMAPFDDDARWKDTSQMEGLLHKIKSERNACVHEWSQTIMDEDQLKNKAEKLQKDFEEALEKVRDRYGICARETKTVIDNVKGDIKHILKSFPDNVIPKMNFEKRLEIFKERAAYHLRDRYRHFECFDPLSFLCESQRRVHIQTVFIKSSVQQEYEPFETSSLNILKVLREKCQRFPHLAVLSGIAGSGKTTLLTFIVSEWCREEYDRRVKHLEEYDIVLRILCRDKHAEDLETFLRLILPPSLCVFREPFVNYLKRCKVLFLIDGFDEMNKTSKKLVSNILTIFNCNKDFTCLITSRPEHVRELSHYKGYYHLSRLSIKGIPVAKRMEFALKYSTSSTNEERLREFMAQHQDNELFELPLNLLFLVKLFEDKPDSNKKRITQASLYTDFHKWCTAKLYDRIATHPKHGKKRPLTIMTRIKKVLKEMYQMALKDLLQDRLTLSEEDTERLEKLCKEEELPEREVLGAFYTLRLFVNNRVCKVQYSLPHKGLLEYFAARHIIQSLPPSGAVRSVLHTVTQERTFRGQCNLFFHVAGLLARKKVSKRPQAMKEVIKELIELVAETGAMWEEWLALVEHTASDISFLEAIAYHVTENPPDDTVTIRDSALASAAKLLPLTLSTITVVLRLHNEKVDNVHCALTHHQCSELWLHHHYEHPGSTPASDTVLYTATNRSRLRMFTGHLSADCLALLPERLWGLCLAVSSDEHAGRLIPALNRTVPSLPYLRRLVIHVPVKTVTPAAVVSPLPDIHPAAAAGVCLVLSGVEESLVTEASQVAVALQPKTGYYGILFPRGRMATAAWRRLLDTMAAAGIRIGWRVVWRGREEVWGGICIPNETMMMVEQRELNQLSYTLWQCNLFRYSDEECFYPQYLPSSLLGRR